jgi:hypothetical protein
MRKLTLLAGTVALVALSGCTYYDDGYYRDGYYGGYYGDYYGGYYDPYYTGPNWYFDGTYYFDYDRHSHRWHRRDHGDRGHQDRNRRGDRDWNRSHDWHGDRNAPWNRPGANTRQQDRSQRPVRGRDHDRDRGASGRRDDNRGQVRQPRTLAPPSRPQQSSTPDASDRDRDRDRPHRGGRNNQDH